MHRILYIAACIVLPLVWGLIVVFVSNHIDEWAKRHGKKTHGGAINPDDAMRVEYHI